MPCRDRGRVRPESERALAAKAWLPTAAIAPIGRIATLLTVVPMAALGLGVDVRTVAKAGGRVTAAVVLSLLGLGAISFTLLAVLRIA